ncbi:hypothetical protein BD847_0869 [Flavobacterium cutihirudinis]|uniref:Uncharacterized protein n=1 Tax=Flavobacterium cutihirudinis TaxID=1265740 RepID=A0A3D9G145_9FLAO|nr:hypothetical protein [Flavobacterium cutihirudinis]RED26938.1 hypothetical protein BD847_0869 [Flavobacterium cutihirudinis]
MNEPQITIEWKMLLFTILALTILTLVILLISIPVKMANKRGRSGFGWFIFCLFFSPFLAMLLLAVLGETDEKRRERIIEEEKLRNQYREPVATNSTNEIKNWLQANPGKSLNDYYRKI